MSRSLLALLLLGPAVAAGPPYPPEPVPGALVIVGGGKLPASVRDEFIKLAGGTEKAVLVVIPTASEAADQEKQHESYLKPWKDAGVKSVSILHTRDKARANEDDFVKPLRSATAIWFSGGDQSRLTAVYLGTAVEKELRQLQLRGGVIGGTSAGAAVLSDLMITGGAEEARTAAGLGLLPGIVVDQHFSERRRLPRLQGVISKNPEYVGLGLDESAALIVQQGRYLKIAGDGATTLVLARSATKDALAEKMTRGALDLFQLRRAAYFRSLKEPFPPAKAAVPEVPKGTLVIVGGGSAGAEIWNIFIDKAGGKQATLVVVSTALEDPVPAIPHEAMALQRHGATNVKVLHTRDRKKADTDEFSAVLTEAGGLWFSGGRQWRFVDAYEGTLTEKRFREVLTRGGVIGGSSAGASIQSEYMPRGHPRGNTVMAAEGYERGFGFLPGCAVDQHFFARNRTKDMTGLMQLYPQLLGIGIDEGTAIVVSGSTAEVIGKSKVGFYDYRQKPREGERDYIEVQAGGKYDLKERKPLK